MGRLTREQADGGLANAVFAYDSMGRILLELECTPLNCSGGGFSKLAYAYDKLGDLTAHSNTTDNITFTNSYDAAARLTQIQRNFTDSQHPATQISFVSFTPFDAPLQANLGNGIDEYFVYSKRKQLLGMNQSPLGSGMFAFNIINPSNGSNGYAPNGNILFGNDSAIGLWAYTYDDMNRLVKGACGACSIQTTGFQYSYDRFGNRLQETVTGVGTQPSYSFDANNHITSSSGVVYDAAGHVTNDGLGTSYTYDAEDRITSVSGANSATYVYDADGHRVRATVNGQIRDFIFDLGGRTIAQLTAGAWTRSEVYAGNSHVASFTSSATEFDYSDWLGTFRMRSDVSGNWLETCSSLPFGEDLTCNGSADITPLHFTGKERDAESNLDYFGRRHYGSAIGRFMQPDEAFNDQNARDPQSWNLYSYVRNNPLRYTDPTGTACVQDPSGNWDNDNSGGESCEDVTSNDQNNPTVSATVTAKALPTEAEYFAGYLTGMGYSRAWGLFIANWNAGVINRNLATWQLMPVAGFTTAELTIAQTLEADGNAVEALEVVPGQKNPDALVNGVQTEFKTVTVAGPNTLKNQIQDGLKQAPNVVVDARGTSITKDQAMQQIQRVEGNIGSVQGRVTILTNEGIVKH